MKFTFSFWLVWMTLTVVLVAILGWYQKFVTRKISGRVVTVVRIPIKAVKIVIFVATTVFGILLSVESFIAILQAIDSTMPSDSSPVWSLFFVPIAIILLVYCYKCMLCLVFNEAKRLHDKKLKDDIIWLMIARES